MRNTKTGAKSQKKHNRLTEDGRKKISLAQKRRWRAYRRERAGAVVGRKKSKVMAAGR